jgi:hypothetical protein
VFVAARGDHVPIVRNDVAPPLQSSVDPPSGLTWIDLVDGKLSCTSTNANAGTLPAIDCSEGHVIRTGGIDPFSITFLPEIGAKGSLAVGHLAPDFDRFADGTSITYGDLAVVDLAAWDLRIRREASTTNAGLPLEQYDPVNVQRFLGMPGITGMVHLSPSLDGRPKGALLVVSHDATSDAPSPAVQLFHPVLSATTSTVPRGTLIPGVVLPLAGLTHATGMRGVTLSADQTRAYASLRLIQNPGTTGPIVYGSALAVFKIEGSNLRLLSTVEIGTELGAPAILDRSRPECGGGGGRTIYLPDQRDDRLWLVDVTSDLPLVLGTIEGRVSRTEAPTRLRVLDTPVEVRLVCHPDAITGFITNFAGNTLTLLDATPTDPRLHKLLVRIGVAQLLGRLVEGEE